MSLKKSYTTIKELCILNEFYHTKNQQFIKGINIKEYKNKILSRLLKIIYNNGMLYKDDENGLFKHMLIGIMQENLDQLDTIEIYDLKQQFKSLMQKKTFRKVFYTAISLIFSCDINEISSMLELKCCLSLNHYEFCKGK